MKGPECLSVPDLTQFSTAPGRRGIVGSRRLARDARRRRGVHSRAPPVVRKATLPSLGPPNSSRPPIPSSSILQFKMATAAAAAAAAARVAAAARGGAGGGGGGGGRGGAWRGVAGPRPPLM